MSLKLAVGVRTDNLLESNDSFPYTIPKNLYLAKDVLNRQKGLQTYSVDTLLSLEPAVGVRYEKL